MTFVRRLLGYRLTYIVLALCLAVAALRYLPVRALGASRTFYVSRAGSNGDGLSWGAAWNELNQIKWDSVAPGDSILLDGGAVACPSLGPGYNCGMVYNTALSVAKSGAPGAPITVRLASEAGRNGTVIIDGGVTTWSACAEYASEPPPPSTQNGTPARKTGIDMRASQWVIIDGTKWGGIEVRNHTRYGLDLSSSQRVLARYLKLHHNTDPTDTTNGAVGVAQNWDSRYNTLSRLEIFRNGQDGVRGGGDYLTLEESYLHDTYCNHPDGIQSFVDTSLPDVPDDEGEVRGLVVRRNVFDTIGLQTIFLGENDTHNSWNVDVTIHDNVFLNSSYVIKSKHGASSNWKIINNTVINAANFAVEWCCANPGAAGPMVIKDNIFVNVKDGGTAFFLPTAGNSTSFTGNCLFHTGRRVGGFSEAGTVTADPLFVAAAAGNYTLMPGSPCAGKGANLTSVLALLNLECASTPVEDDAGLAPADWRVYLPLMTRSLPQVPVASCY